MTYNSLMSILVDPQTDVWVTGKKIGTHSGANIWEYEFKGAGYSRVVVRGVSSNNLKIMFASSDYGVFLDGIKLNLEKMQYLDVLSQVGYLHAVVQPMKLSKQINTK